MAAGDHTTFYCCSIFLLICAVVFTCIFVPLSYAYLEYNTMGFLVNTVNKNVDLSQVYTAGRYYVGVGYTFETYNTDNYDVDFSLTGNYAPLSVWNEENLSFVIECGFQYHLIKEQLVDVHNRINTDFNQLVVSTAQSIIKNHAVNYTSSQYLNYRREIEVDLLQQLNTSLASLDVVVDYFQLKDVQFPDEYITVLLNTAIQQISNEGEVYVQNATIYRLQTEALVQFIINNGTQVIGSATNLADLVVQQANNAALNLTESARITGLRDVYTALGIQDEAQRAAFDYLRTLRDHPSANININYLASIVNSGSANGA